MNSYFFSSRVFQMWFQTLVTNNQTSGKIEICPLFWFSSASKLNRKCVSCLYNSSTKGSNFLTCCGFLCNVFLVICPTVSKICWISTLLTEYTLYVSISIILSVWEVIGGCTDCSIFVFEFKGVIALKEVDQVLLSSLRSCCRSLQVGGK